MSPLMTLPKTLRACVVLVAALAGGSTWAHELEADRLTLVQRQDHLIEATWWVDLPAVLHRLLASKESYPEFLARLAASPLQDVDQVLARARQRWAEEVVFTANAKDRGAWQRWEWPDAKALQAAARDRLMQNITGSHEHFKPVKIQAQWQAKSGAIASLRITVPPSLKPLVIVSYRPRQAVMDSHQPFADVRF